MSKRNKFWLSLLAICAFAAALRVSIDGSERQAALATYTKTIRAYADKVNESATKLEAARTLLSDNVDNLSRSIDLAEQLLDRMADIEKLLPRAENVNPALATRIAKAQDDAEHLRSELRSLANANAPLNLQSLPPPPPLMEQGSIERPFKYSGYEPSAIFISRAYAQDTAASSHSNLPNAVRVEVYLGVLLLLGLVLVVGISGMMFIQDSKRSAHFVDLVKLLIAFFIGVCTNALGSG